MKIFFCFILLIVGCGQKEVVSSSLGVLDLYIGLPESTTSNESSLEEIQKYIISFEGESWKKVKTIQRKEILSETFTDIPRERSVKVTVEALNSQDQTIFMGSQSFDFTAAKPAKIVLKEKEE